jgi:hypothetical protein
MLGQAQSTAFHEKWILHRASRESDFLRAPDASALSDFADSFERIRKLKPFPADLTSLYGLAAAIALPALPVVLAEIPVVVVLTDLFKALDRAVATQGGAEDQACSDSISGFFATKRPQTKLPDEKPARMAWNAFM